MVDDTQEVAAVEVDKQVVEAVLNEVASADMDQQYFRLMEW